MKLLLRLYPKAWRERYGDELEELMSDTPAGWRTSFDVIKGAIAMRLKSSSAIAITAGLMGAGVLAGLLVSYFFTPMWQARLAGQVTPSRISNDPLSNERQGNRAADFLQQKMNKVLQDIDATTRQNIRFQIDPKVNPKNASRVFIIGFTDSDPQKAVDTTNTLFTRLLQESTRRGAAQANESHFVLEPLDFPVLPKHRFFPKRSGFMFVGCMAGLFIALVTLLVRRRLQSPGPGLQPA